MEVYSVAQWLLVFYFYCFIGWIWESSFVSICEKKLVNRGFLKGPLIPIYGSGAIVVIFTTMYFRGSIILIYIIGMLAATILEYVTGSVMERLFHVRYWDYSEEFCNVKGHICLKASLLWGVFSVLLIKVINMPIEKLVIKIPIEISEGLAFVITFIIAVDIVISFNEAMDLKRILIKLNDSKEAVNNIKRRLEITKVFISEDIKLEINSLEEKVKERVSALKLDNKHKYWYKSWHEVKGSYISTIEYIKQSEEERKNKKMKKILCCIKHNNEERETLIKALVDCVYKYLNSTDKLPDNLSKETLEQRRKINSEIVEYLNKLKKQQNNILNIELRIYLNSLNILRRNPKAKTSKYKEAMEEIRNIEYKD